jgi:tRNA (mo5U34)-methyltransferase
MTMSRTTIRLPSPPAHFDAETFFAGIQWHQKWQVFDRIYTPGVNPIEEMCSDLQLPACLTGKRVLDIGAWNGCLSFECERRGAREIVALSPEDPHTTGFHKLREAIGSSRVQYVRGTVYDLNPRRLGYFDLVLFCGVLYHLRYPLLGIDNIRRVCSGEVYVETVVSDAQLIVQEEMEYKKIPMDSISPHLLTAPLWQFYRFGQLDADPSNWFGPNSAAVVEAFESAGFRTRVLKNLGRATFHGTLKEGPPEFLTIGTTEGVHYDTVTSSLLGKDGIDDSGSGVMPSFSERILCDVLGSREYYEKHGNQDHAWLRSVHKQLLGHATPGVSSAELLRRIHDDDEAFRYAVLENLLTSTEYWEHRVGQAYHNVLGRNCSQGELDHWNRFRQRGGTTQQPQAEFLASEEYYRKQGSSNSSWLVSVHSQLTGRRPGSEGEVFLEALAGNSASRMQIVTSIFNSLACRQHLLRMLYTTHLGRQYSREEAEGWMNRSRAPVAA